MLRLALLASAVFGDVTYGGVTVQCAPYRQRSSCGECLPPSYNRNHQLAYYCAGGSQYECKIDEYNGRCVRNDGYNNGGPPPAPTTQPPIEPSYPTNPTQCPINAPRPRRVGQPRRCRTIQGTNQYECFYPGNTRDECEAYECRNNNLRGNDNRRYFASTNRCNDPEFNGNGLNDDGVGVRFDPNNEW